MASDHHHAYIESVRRVVSQGDLLRACKDQAPRVVEKLSRLRDEATGRSGDDIIALLRTELRQDDIHPSTQLFAQTLLTRGYDAANATEMAIQLRKDYPRFDPNMAMLMGKEALEEELGPFYGRMISSMLVDPSCQPILHAILFANDSDPVVETRLTCATRTMACRVERHYRTGYTFSPWDSIGNTEIISNHLAASHYYRVTGETLLDKVHIHANTWKR